MTVRSNPEPAGVSNRPPDRARVPGHALPERAVETTGADPSWVQKMSDVRLVDMAAGCNIYKLCNRKSTNIF